jgi:poly(3-hydroxybutyrate) depolymerase
MLSSLLLSSVFLSLVPSISGLALKDSDRKCHKPLPDDIKLGKSANLTIDSSSGVSPRKYRIHVPKTYDSSKNVPVILSFHGRGKDAKFQEKLSKFSNSTYGFEGIVVYPEGIPVS